MNSKQLDEKIIKEHFNPFKINEFTNYLKISFTNESIGEYERALQLLIYALKNEEYKKYISNDEFISNMLDYFNAIILSEDSIFQVRKIEVILCYIDYTFPNQSEKCSKELEKMCSEFYNYDMLTQLTFLETLENDINNEKILELTKPGQNLLNQNVMELQQQSLRKLLFTFSKFYARDLLNFDIKLLKNTLAISFQYYNDYPLPEFICPVILNVFHNFKIYPFLMDSANNSQFDFLENINEIITENYINPEPKVKIQVLEIFAKIFKINENDKYKDMQIQYNNTLIKKIILKYKGSIVKDEKDGMEKFSEIIYNDFKKRDIPDYEYPFLECILSILNNDNFVKCLLSNFDFVLYLLERRDRSKEICQKKYDIIQEIVKNENIMNQMSNEFSSKFIDYIAKGPFGNNYTYNNF